MAAISAEVADGNILQLCEKFLKAGVMEGNKFLPTKKGTPQGGVISPLLANAVLHTLDTELDTHGFKFVRYADDFVVMCKTEAQAQGALGLVKEIMDSLGLELSQEKTHVTHSSKGFEFLGFIITTRNTKMRDKSKEKFKQKLRDLTKRSRNLDARVIEKLNQVIRGTVNYFSTPLTHTLTQFYKLDEWLRKRIRCMKYKRISARDNLRYRRKYIDRLGLLSCYDLSRARTRYLC
jgi:RNA-directed DNA polymerase